MAKEIKMCDMLGEVAATVFKMINYDDVLNHNVVNLKKIGNHIIIVTDVEPKDLIYPEGWYYAKGAFRNKHTSTTGRYSEIKMQKSTGEHWKDLAIYCTHD